MTREGQVRGRKMCRCDSASFTVFIMSDFMVELSSVPEGMEVRRWWNITSARRGTLKWCRGSKRATALALPWRLMLWENVSGRRAWVMIRWRREVFPGLEG